MLPALSTWRPVGDSVAARLRSCPATLLVEWELALVELRLQYWAQTRVWGNCVLCGTARLFEQGCDLCPWMTFEGETCEWATPPYKYRTPSRRIGEISRWLKRIRAEIRARGI